MWTYVFIRRRRCVGPGVFDSLIGRHESTTLQLQCCFLFHAKRQDVIPQNLHYLWCF